MAKTTTAMVTNNNTQDNSKLQNLTTNTVNAGLSVAFYNKSIRDGYTRSAYANSFINTELTTSELVQHIRNGYAFSMSTFTENKRQRGNFIQSQLLALDLDEANMSVSDILEHEHVNAYAFFVGETASSTPEHRKARVLFKLDTPVTEVEKWQALQRAVLHTFADFEPDEACKDVARLFYGSDNGDHVARVDRTLPLDVVSAWLDELDSVEPEQQPQQQPQRTPELNQRIIEQNATLTHNTSAHEAYARATLDNVTAELSALTDGRNKKLLDSAIMLGSMISAGMINEHEVRSALLNASIANGYEGKRHDSVAVINRGFEYTRNKPFDLSKLSTRSASRRVNLNNAPAVQERINEAFDMSPLTFTADRFSAPYVSMQHITDGLAEHDILALRSGMGTGKTTALSQYVKTHKNRSVLVITPFEQLSTRSAVQFGIESYKDIDTFYMPSVPRLAITAKSLPKLQRADGSFPKFDMVIIDEVDHIHEQFGSNLYKGNASHITQHAYSELLSNADNVVVTSAHITDVEIEAIDTYTHGRKSIRKLHNTFTRDMPTLTIFNSQHALIDNALNLATRADKPVMIACGGRETAQKIALLAQRYGLAEHDIFILTSDNSNTDEARAIARDPNTHIPQYKLFIYTFSVGVGMDYTGACAGMYGLFTIRDMTPLADIQMLQRARNADTYNAFVTPGIQNKDTNGYEGLQSLQRNHQRTANFVSIVGALSPVDTYTRLHCELEAQNNHTLTDKLSCFVQLAREQGHAIEFNEQRSTKAQKAVWSEITALLKKIRRDNTLAVDYRLSAREFQQLRANRTQTDMCKYARLADIIEQTTGELLDEESYDLFNTSKKRQQLRLFTNVFSATKQDMKQLDTDEALDMTPLERRQHYTYKQYVIKRFLMDLTGTSVFGDVEKAIKNSEDLLKEQWLERVADFLDAFEQDIKDVFGWRSDYSKDRFALLQWLLSRVGFKLKRGKRSSEGKRGYYYAFDVDMFNTLSRYAKSRTKHLKTLTDVDNPLSMSRIKNNLIRNMDTVTVNVEKLVSEAFSNGEPVEKIPI